MDNYEVLGPIGQGSFAKVFKILRKSDQKIFVWKEMLFAKMSDKEKQQLVYYLHDLGFRGEHTSRIETPKYCKVL